MKVRALILSLAAFAQVAAAQSVRVTGSTTMRYVELRTLARDSVAAGETPGEGILRQLPDGRIVRCIPGDDFCRDTRPGAVASTLPVTQDLEASAWGFGRGIHLFTHLRARAAWGSRDLWPRGEDALDLIALFAQLERERVRITAGRQWKVSGLGIYNFDGIAATARAGSSTSLEVYAGRSLLRGQNEARPSGVLQAVEELAPPEPGTLVGLQARYRPDSRFSASALYQVDFRLDGRGIYSELAIADGVWRIAGGSVEGSVEMDLASNALNQARILFRPPPKFNLAPFAELRRHRPYFELWTIWGAFSPIGFDEARGGTSWVSADAKFIARAEASYRRYEDSGADQSFDSYNNDGWGLGANIGFRPGSPWRFDAAYRIESGFGAARREGQLAANRLIGSSGSLAVHALAFQRLYEFRLNEGTVLGLGAEGAFPLSDRSRIFAGATVYRHLGGGSSSGLDWNQRRANVRIQWTLGTEPAALPPVPGSAR